MTPSHLAAMNEQEFDRLIDSYITRTSTTYGEMPGEFFLDLLFERMSTQIDETLILSINIADDDLVIQPDQDMGDIVIRGNEILIGNRRLVLQLVGQEK